MEEMKPWDILDNMTINKKDYDSHNEALNKAYKPYHINRYISAVDLYVPIVNEINVNGKSIPKETHYLYFKSVLPKSKIWFFKEYNKIKKVKDVDLDMKLKICEYFECGMGDAERYISSMTDEQIENIVNVYRHGKSK